MCFSITVAPFATAMVSWIEDEEVGNPDELKKLSDSVLKALKDVVSLTGKLRDSETILPDDLPDLPRELSFWVGAHLAGPVATEQQSLLELNNTLERLQREFDMLDHTRKQLAARSVIKETFENVDQANN